MTELIDLFKKNVLEEIRVSLTEFNGHQLVGLKTWTENKAGEPIPDKRCSFVDKGGPISCPSEGRRAPQRGLI
jgi:hypothetical protein